jgi:hypothetical protein
MLVVRLVRFDRYGRLDGYFRSVRLDGLDRFVPPDDKIRQFFGFNSSVNFRVFPW